MANENEFAVVEAVGVSVLLFGGGDTGEVGWERGGDRVGREVVKEKVENVTGVV
jgi:hypothetical protein